MPTTTNYGWTTPADTDLVKDGASAIRTLGTAIDTTVFNNAGAAIAKTIVDAKGDLIVATAADTVARLAVGGTNGHVLQVDSSTASGLKWDAAPAGGMTLINTGGTSIGGSSTVSISSIPATYNYLQLVIRNFRPSADTAIMRLRFNNDSNTRYRSFATFNVSNANYDSTSFDLNLDSDNGASDSLMVFNIWDYANTTTWKNIDGFTYVNNPTTTTNINFYRFIGLYNQTGAISEINLLSSSGNFTSGTAYLYGVK